jgi:hypothetical protein
MYRLYITNNSDLSVTIRNASRYGDWELTFESSDTAKDFLLSLVKGD